jgi:hypothetical protein
MLLNESQDRPPQPVTAAGLLNVPADQVSNNQDSDAYTAFELVADDVSESSRTISQTSQFVSSPSPKELLLN